MESYLLYAEISQTTEFVSIITAIFGAFTTIMTAMISVFVLIIKSQQNNQQAKAIVADQKLQSVKETAVTNTSKLDEVHSIVNDRQTRMLEEIADLRKQVKDQAAKPIGQDELMKQVELLRRQFDEQIAKSIEAAKNSSMEAQKPAEKAP